jgi:uncharacterized protein YigE (DUF2233 family)
VPAKAGSPLCGQVGALGPAWLHSAFALPTAMKTLLLVLWFAELALTNSASAVEFTTVEFAGKPFTVCRVNVRKEHLQLLYRDGNGQPFKRFDRLTPWIESRGQKLIFAMNAGMYQRDFSPVGLFVSGGQQVVPLNTTNGEGNFFLKPNGVFVITTNGAQVMESSEYLKLREHVDLATQSGPLLVCSGKLHPAFNTNSQSRLLRNGVGVPSPDVALFVISEVPVNFYEFASLFRDKLHCQDALFLDGVVSSLYAPQLKRSDSRKDLGPIIAVSF